MYAREFRNFIGPFPSSAVQHGLYARREFMPDVPCGQDFFHQTIVFSAKPV
jgi:hypothetical protein